MRPLLALVIIVGLLFAIYHFHLVKMPSLDAGTTPTQAVSLVAVRGKLIQIAQGERGYIALNGNCASLDELVSSNTVSVSSTDLSGYSYSVECIGDSFDVKAEHVAAPAGSSVRYPSFVIDGAMQIQEIH
jgi:hypothetical protein